MPDEYVTVSCVLKRATPKAVLVQPEGEPAAVWVPRSCIHGADDRQIDKWPVGEDIEIRVFEWLAEREGLV